MSQRLENTAFVFPGQGSQAVGMGKDLAEAFPKAATLFRRADEILGFALSTLCFEGPEDQLKQTENTQPALYVTSCAILEVLRDQGVGVPESVAGHSLGEYSALYAAGVFDFETGLRLVRVRGEAMRDAGRERPGAMTAVLGLEGAKVAQLCEQTSQGDAVAANFNAPDQTVISGDVDAVNRAASAIKDAGARRVVPLPVSGAFHSPLVRSAAEIMEKKLAYANLRPPTDVRFINNADAEIVEDPDTIRNALVRQIVSPVRWVETIERVRDLGTRRYVEVGSGKVLAGLIKRIDRQAETLATDSVDSLNAAIQALKA
jgi:[acyl-carrier-protein] S-malonyltransferase